MPLTHTIINRLTPSEKCTPSRPDKHSDGDGLQLWVRHTGNKVWVSAYRWQGKQQSLTLGKYPVITLQQARQRNLEIKQQINEDINPKDKKKEKLAEQDGSRLFDNIAQAWYADRKTFLATSTFGRNYSAYMRDVKPVIGHKLIDDITSPDILTIGKSIEARGANEMARRIMAEVGQIFKHAIRIGIATSNPAADLSAAIKPHKTKNHSRIISKDLQIQFDNVVYQIITTLQANHLAGREVLILQEESGSLTAILNHQILALNVVLKQKKKPVVVSTKSVDHQLAVPAVNHPWRSYGKKLNGEDVVVLPD